MKNIVLSFCLLSLPAAAGERGQTLVKWPDKLDTGSVVFLHPDGSSLAHWDAARMHWKGPDGHLNWDRIPHTALYRGHMRDALAATSHGGGTTHAYGVKVPRDSFGLYGKEPLYALSGQPHSVLTEARLAGKGTGLVNSGSIVEPGTATFVSRSPSRGLYERITREVIESGTDVIMSGGERWMLPEGVEGRHGPGARKDGTNLIAVAETLGYTVVYDRTELAALPDGTKRVLGVFAGAHTFNDSNEETLKAAGKPFYAPDAPTLAEMTEAALKVLGQHPNGFLLVVEEEGSDNFSNVNNAAGALESLKRADDAIEVVRRFRYRHRDTLLIMAADSCASGLQVLSPFAVTEPVPAGLDGREGDASLPFVSAPDQFGRQHGFAVAWTGGWDAGGGIVARAEGLNAFLVSGAIDNTDIYRIMYATLFGRCPDAVDADD